MTKPLQGIKVLDLTTFVAAPVCARILGEMSALEESGAVYRSK